MEIRLHLLAAGLLWLRLLMGLGIAFHGYSMIFDGKGLPFLALSGQLGSGMDVFLWVGSLVQLIGGILIVLGLSTRLAAFLVFLTTGYTAFLHLASAPFKARELSLAYFAVAGTLILTGPGRLSLDNLFKRRSE